MTVHTTYFGGIGTYYEPADEAFVLGVVRRPQDFVDRVTDRNAPVLGPPADLLDAFKRVEATADDDNVRNPSAVAWRTVNFEHRYRNYLQRKGPQRALDNLRDRVQECDMWLVCWEKDVRTCHRRILADVLVTGTDDEVEHHPAPKEIEDEDEDDQDQQRDATITEFGGETA